MISAVRSFFQEDGHMKVAGIVLKWMTVCKSHICLFIIIPAEIQKDLHTAADIAASAPDQPRSGQDLRSQRDADSFREERDHILIEKTPAAAFLHKSEDRWNLTAAHYDPGMDVQS